MLAGDFIRKLLSSPCGSSADGKFIGLLREWLRCFLLLSVAVDLVDEIAAAAYEKLIMIFLVTEGGVKSCIKNHSTQRSAEVKMSKTNDTMRRRHTWWLLGWLAVGKGNPAVCLSFLFTQFWLTKN